MKRFKTALLPCGVCANIRLVSLFSDHMVLRRELPIPVWGWAGAAIGGDTVVVPSPQVSRPSTVRYAYARNPEECNLYNRAGLPASPFEAKNSSAEAVKTQ